MEHNCRICLKQFDDKVGNGFCVSCRKESIFSENMIKILTNLSANQKMLISVSDQSNFVSISHIDETTLAIKFYKLLSDSLNSKVMSWRVNDIHSNIIMFENIESSL